MAMTTSNSITFTPLIRSTSTFWPLRNSKSNAGFFNISLKRQNLKICVIQQEFSKSTQFDSHTRVSYVYQASGRDHRNILKPISAAGPGLEASVTDAKDSTLTFKNVEISVESQNADKMKLRVDLVGEETKKAFDVVLANLARSAPPVPGFRRQKGGKTAKVPRNLLLDILGKDRVTKFVLREIVTSTVASYVKEENLSVRDNKINTTQTEDELKQSFSPGNAFGFNVELELVNENIETTNGNSEV